MPTSTLSIILIVATILLAFLITLVAGNVSIKILDIEGRHPRWKFWYYVSYRAILIGGTVILYQSELPARIVLLFPFLISVIVGILYFRTRGWKYVIEPIVFGFFLLVFLISLGAIMFAARATLFTPVAITGDSMAPALVDGDVGIVTKSQTYVRGDIILYNHFNNEFVKRIISLPPNEVISIKDGAIQICTLDKPCADLVEPYLAPNTKTEALCGTKAFKVDRGYFVMGDNRSESVDSRSYLNGDCAAKSETLVTASRVLGKVVYTIPKQYVDFLKSLFPFS